MKKQKNRKYLETKRWRERNPTKIKAHRIVFSAVRNGTLIRKPCYCGKKRTEAHHEDYLQPLKVTWLCRKHHLKLHADLLLYDMVKKDKEVQNAVKEVMDKKISTF